MTTNASGISHVTQESCRFWPLNSYACIIPTHLHIQLHLVCLLESHGGNWEVRRAEDRVKWEHKLQCGEVANGRTMWPLCGRKIRVRKERMRHVENCMLYCCCGEYLGYVEGVIVGHEFNAGIVASSSCGKEHLAASSSNGDLRAPAHFDMRHL